MPAVLIKTDRLLRSYLHGNVVSQFLENLVAGHKVRFAVEFYQCPDSAAGVDVGFNNAVFGFPSGAFFRDFAFTLDSAVSADTVVRAAKGADKALVSDVTVFDLYEGDKMAAGKKSLAITVTLQPTEKTLTDEEIEAVAAKIVQAVTKASGGDATYAKIEAARRLGLPVLMIRRPPPPAGKTVETIAAALGWLEDLELDSR